MHLVGRQAEVGRDAARDVRVVAGQDGEARQALAAQRVQALAGVRARRVGDAQEAEQPRRPAVAEARHHDDAPARGLQRRQRLVGRGIGVQVDALARDQAPVAGPGLQAVDATDDAAPRPGLDAVGRCGVDAALAGVAHDGARDRVFAGVLEGGCHPQQLVLVDRERHDVGHRHDPARQGAGLVEGDRVDRGEGLQRAAPLEQHAAPCGGGERRQHGRRHADDHRARARHHEQRGGAVEGFRSGQPEREERRERHGRAGEDPDGIALAEPVAEALAGGFRRLRLGHQLHHPRERRMVGRLGDPHGQRAVAVDGAGEHFTPRLFVDGHGLARDRRLVDGRLSGRHHPVERHSLPRAHAHEVVDGDVLGRTIDLDGVHDDVRDVGPQRHQRRHRPPGGAHRPLFEGAGEAEQEQQDRAVARRADRRGRQRGQHHQQVDLQALARERANGLDPRGTPAGEEGEPVRPGHDRLEPSPARDEPGGEAGAGEGGPGDAPAQLRLLGCEFRLQVGSVHSPRLRPMAR